MATEVLPSMDKRCSSGSNLSSVCPDVMGLIPGMDELPSGMMLHQPRKHPYELHWRVRPPEWPGNLDKAHLRLYGHLADHPCCYYCGAIPCPYDHDKEKATRLVDLEFIKDMAKERKELKKELEKLRQEICRLQEKSKEANLEKLMALARLRELEQRQKEWQQEKMTLEAEIRRLLAVNDQHEYEISIYKKNEAKMKLLQIRLEALQSENEQLHTKNKKMAEHMQKQTAEITALNQANDRLSTDLQGAQSTVRKLKVQVDQVTESLETLQKEAAAKDAKVNDLQAQLSGLLEDIEIKTKTFKQKEMECEEMIEILRHEIERLNSEVSQGNERQLDLQAQLDAALQEIERLRRRLSRDSRFQQFVEVKREVIDLREQNEALITKFGDELKPVLPMMQRTGKVMPRRPSNASPDLTSLRLTHRRVKSAMGRRPSVSSSLS